MKDLISIIIPTYNRADLIHETLNSIQSQTYTNWECIIIDDHSNDNTIDVISKHVKEDSRFLLFKRPEDKVKGANACRNYGFTLVKGEYINWFDSDDIMEPNFIEEKIKHIKPTVDAVLHRNKYANYILTRFRDSKFEYDNNSLFYNYAMEHIEIQTSGFMWKRSFLENKKLFDETITRYQDNEFHIRMLAFKPNVKIINIILAIIRGGDGDKNQISSKTSLSKKKLYDIFYYRFQCLKLAKENQFYLGEKFNKVLAKKALWAFYSMLRFEPNFIKKLRDVCKYYSKIRFVYSNPQISYLDMLRSQLYILKIIIFK